MSKGQVQRADHEADQAQFVDASSDERTLNNAVRHQYRVLSDAEKDHMQAIKDAGVAFLKALQAGGVKGRYLSISEQKVEEAVMWSVKGLTQ